MLKHGRVILLAAPIAMAAIPAQAYIGPGVGAGTIAVVLAILVAIFLAFFAVLWFPAKRLIKKRRAAIAARADDDGAKGDLSSN